MRKYVFENNYDEELFDDKEKAIKHYEYMFSLLTDREKEKLEYFRLYEIDYVEDYEGDLIDLMVGDYIRFFK